MKNRDIKEDERGGGERFKRERKDEKVDGRRMGGGKKVQIKMWINDGKVFRIRWKLFGFFLQSLIRLFSSSFFAFRFIRRLLSSHFRSFQRHSSRFTTITFKLNSFILSAFCFCFLGFYLTLSFRSSRSSWYCSTFNYQFFFSTFCWIILFFFFCFLQKGLRCISIGEKTSLTLFTAKPF